MPELLMSRVCVTLQQQTGLEGPGRAKLMHFKPCSFNPCLGPRHGVLAMTKPAGPATEAGLEHRPGTPVDLHQLGVELRSLTPRMLFLSKLPQVPVATTLCPGLLPLLLPHTRRGSWG